MKSQRIPMPIDEYHLLEMKPGWKYEYWDGKAHISPSPRYAITTVPVAPRVVTPNLKIRAVRRRDEAELIDAFFDAFKDTAEYCDWEESDIYLSAVDGIKTHFSGKRGKPYKASTVIISRDQKGNEMLAGAALLVQGAEHPFLDILFVRTQFQTQGLATALVSAALNRLHKRGEQKLSSAYRLCNEASSRWHRSFGFVEEPDLPLAQLLLRCARHELWRREEIGNLSSAEREALESECVRLEEIVQTLEEIAERQGLEVVYPALRNFQR